MEYPIVSVVITTKNEQKHIEKCLLSIRKQTYPTDKIETIIVDNASSDKTKQIAKKFTKLVFDKGPERSAQRNFGAHQAHGAYLLYLDADMSVSSGLIKECVKLFDKDTKLVAVYIPEIITGNKFWSKARKFERSFYNATSIDCVRFIKMSVFKKVGGFDETMSGPEDWDFDKKVRHNGTVTIVKQPLYHNESEIVVGRYIKKKEYYAKSFNTYIAKWGKNDIDIKKQFGLYYRFVGVFIENGKWKKILQHPILFIGIMVLRFQVGLAYLKVRGRSKYD